jgi:DNA-binding transcriptional LysR family regulator
MTTVIQDWEKRIGRRLRLRDLHILSSVVQWGSMAQAAKHLGMSQPSVSEAIVNLEATLRVRLLDRSPRGVEPTIYARALLKRGLVVFDELKQGIRDIEFLSDPTMGEVRVGCPENLSAGFVPAIIDRFSTKYPRVIISVVNAETAAMEFRELRERTVDLMLGRIFRTFAHEDVDAEVLCEDEYVVVAGAHSRWARCRKLSLAELIGEQWIFLPPNNVPASFYAEAFHAKGIEMPRESVSTFSLHVRLHLLATGHFLTIFPASVLRFNAKRWSLKALPIDLGLPSRPVAIFTLKNRTLSPVVQLFIEHVRAVAKTVSKPAGSGPKRVR